MTEKTLEAERLIWGFLERVAYIMMEDYNGENHPISVDDIKLINTKTVRTKNGREKRIDGPIMDLPFRTRFFFNNTFTDTRRAYVFFCPSNMEDGIKWMRENVWKHIAGGFDILQWAADGKLAHIDAISAKYSHSTPRREI